MRRLTFWAAGCRPSLLLWGVLLLGASMLSAHAQDVATNAAPAPVPVDPVIGTLSQLPWPAVLGALGWRFLGLLERGMVMAESCWAHIQRDGVPKVSVSHVVHDRPERRRDDDGDEDTRP